MILFFGDINALIGSFGFLPLNFIFPMVFYNLVFKPSRRSTIFCLNIIIVLVFSILCILGTIAIVWQIALDANSYKLFANL